MQTQTTERQELHRVIDMLPENSVLAMLDLIKSLQQNTETVDWVDPIEIGAWNTETLDAIRDIKEGKVKCFESKEALFKDLGLC